jgi:cytochrome c
METTNSNKLALALMGTLLATMALGIISSAIFSPHKAIKAGYDLPAAQEAAAAAPAAPAADDPLPGLLAKADPAKGANDTVGPPLYGVVGRPVASIAGFAYSDVLKGMGGDWTYDKIFSFIKSPKGMEPGTKMTFPGESDEHKRADILAYLQTLSDNPVPFPK